jgi:hypothetical protein
VGLRKERYASKAIRIAKANGRVGKGHKKVERYSLVSGSKEYCGRVGLISLVYATPADAPSINSHHPIDHGSLDSNIFKGRK